MAITNSTSLVVELLSFIRDYWYAIFGTWYITRCIRLRYFHKYSHIPGPFLASITDLHSVFVYFTWKSEQYERWMHEKYGPVVRIKPEHIVTNDPKVLPILFHKDAHKTDYQKVGDIGLAGSVFGAIRNEEHTLLKRRVHAAYSMSNIRRMEPIINARILEFLSKIDDLSRHSQFDFAPWSMYFAYDVVSDLAFGKPFGFMKEGKDVNGLIQGFHDLLPFAQTMQRSRDVTSFITGLPGLGALMKITPQDKKGLGSVMGFRDKMLAERLSKGNVSGRADMLQYFLDRKDSPNPSHQIPHDHIKAECLSLMLAGSDTTSTILRSFFCLIVSHPRVYNTLMHEIHTAYSTPGRMTRPIPAYDELLSLPYFQLCLKETIRLTSAVPLFLIRVVDEPGIEIGGLHIPAGSHLGMNPWVVGRNKELYGEDADEFRPERWMGEKAKEMERLDFGWGFGSRVCIGKNIALVELCKVMVEMLYRFTPIRTAPPAKGGYEHSLKNYGVWIEKGLWMQFVRRDIPEWREVERRELGLDQTIGTGTDVEVKSSIGGY